MSTSTFPVPIWTTHHNLQQSASWGKEHVCMLQQSFFPWVSKFLHSAYTMLIISEKSAETTRYKHLTKGLWSLFSIALFTETLFFLQLIITSTSCSSDWVMPSMVCYEQPSSLLLGCTASFSTAINSKSCLCATTAQKLCKHGVKYIICNHVNLYRELIFICLAGESTGLQHSIAFKLLGTTAVTFQFSCVHPKW